MTHIDLAIIRCRLTDVRCVRVAEGLAIWMPYVDGVHPQHATHVVHTDGFTRALSTSERIYYPSWLADD